MTITRSATAIIGTATAGTSHSFSYPGTINEGDLMVWVVHWLAVPGSITVPSALETNKWVSPTHDKTASMPTEARTAGGGTSVSTPAGAISVYHKICDGTETGSETITTANSVRMYGRYARFTTDGTFSKFPIRGVAFTDSVASADQFKTSGWYWPACYNPEHTGMSVSVNFGDWIGNGEFGNINSGPSQNWADGTWESERCCYITATDGNNGHSGGYGASAEFPWSGGELGVSGGDTGASVFFLIREEIIGGGSYTLRPVGSPTTDPVDNWYYGVYGYNVTGAWETNALDWKSSALAKRGLATCAMQRPPVSSSGPSENQDVGLCFQPGGNTGTGLATYIWPLDYPPDDFDDTVTGAVTAATADYHTDHPVRLYGGSEDPYSDDTGMLSVRVIEAAADGTLLEQASATNLALAVFDGTGWATSETAFTTNVAGATATAPSYGRSGTFGSVDSGATYTEWTQAELRVDAGDAANMASDGASIMLVGGIDINITYTSTGGGSLPPVRRSGMRTLLTR